MGHWVKRVKRMNALLARQNLKTEEYDLSSDMKPVIAVCCIRCTDCKTKKWVRV